MSWNDCCDDICEACPEVPGCCKPACEGKQCGPDGCGGKCGKCPSGQGCFDGVCQDCTPSCDGKECGDDGCGGVCGLCLSGSCVANKCESGPGCLARNLGGCDGCPCEECVCAADAWCCDYKWDAHCVDLCLEECGGGCGQLASCGNGTCEPAASENCDTCRADCACQAPLVCGWDTSEAKCLEDFCSLFGTPEIGCCDQNTLRACLNDTIPFIQACGSFNICGWHSGNASTDPGYYCGSSWNLNPAGDPSGKNPLECVTCKGDCTGKTCGDDGCGNTCGICGVGKMCHEGNCCAPNCKNKTCGDNGCGGSCGQCGIGKLCYSGVCKPPCYPDCTNKNCGSDGCDGSCGQCEFGTTCANGKCVPACQPSCEGKICGPNGCGGTCGQCPNPLACVAGQCVLETDAGTEEDGQDEADGDGGSPGEGGGKGGGSCSLVDRPAPLVPWLLFGALLLILRRRSDSTPR
jgi:hypothetical protein